MSSRNRHVSAVGAARGSAGSRPSAPKILFAAASGGSPAWQAARKSEASAFLNDYSVPASILIAIPFMLIVGIAIERGLIRHFYKRPHADQILVTFGLAIVMQEIIKHFFGANPIPQPAPDAFAGTAYVGELFGMGQTLAYPWWRIVYLLFSLAVIGAVSPF